MESFKANLFNKAVDFATKAHEGQTRKWSNSPYIEHPIEVANIVKTMTNDEEVLSAAVLHDTIEDTDVPIEDIQRRFGERVAKLVLSDTENKRKELPAEKTWKIRKQETIDHINQTTDLSEKMIILGDKLSNIRQLAENYRAIGDEVWQKFNQKNKKEQEWYYRSILEATRDLSEYAAWKEYETLVNTIFD